MTSDCLLVCIGWKNRSERCRLLCVAVRWASHHFINVKAEPLSKALLYTRWKVLFLNSKQMRPKRERNKQHHPPCIYVPRDRFVSLLTFIRVTIGVFKYGMLFLTRLPRILVPIIESPLFGFRHLLKQGRSWKKCEPTVLVMDFCWAMVYENNTMRNGV